MPITTEQWPPASPLVPRVGDAALTKGQAGVYSPIRDAGSFLIGLTAGFLFAGRFVAPNAAPLKSVRFGLGVAAGANDACGAAIYSSDGATRVATSGSVSGKLNGTVGPQSIPIPATSLTPGAVYYAALWCGTFGGSAAQILACGPATANALPNLAGTQVGVMEYGLVAAASIPANLTGLTAWGYAPSLFLAQS